MAGNVIHDVAAADGTAIKVEARRAGAPLHEAGSRLYCGLAPGTPAQRLSQTHDPKEE